MYLNYSKSKNIVNLRTNMFAIINHNQTSNILYLDLLSYIRWCDLSKGSEQQQDDGSRSI